MKFKFRCLLFGIVITIATLIAWIYYLRQEVLPVSLDFEYDETLSVYNKGIIHNTSSNNKESQIVVVSEATVDVKTISLWRKVNKLERMFKNQNTVETLISNNDDMTTDAEASEYDVLEAIVVPHSHNDPGWLRTVNDYFEQQTKHILDNMVKKLIQFKNMTFVWAESIFLAMWWEGLDNQTKYTVKQLIKSGRLEILGGGWIVPDEAMTHYSSLVGNFLEGHLWLARNLGVKPRVSWSLDPFGYSSFMPYLYNKMGFKASIVLRIHSQVKKLMVQEKLLEFNWRQTWDQEGACDHRTFVLPFMLYNIKHQCGPHHPTCLLFDFRKISGEMSESLATPINEDNVASLAAKLAEQYHKKASMQRNKHAVLIPLGDDFRYDKDLEWDQQYNNYMKLFEYMNNNPQLKIKARFGVVSDYIRTLDSKPSVVNTSDLHKGQPDLPTLSGDFFPYSDQQGDYWTGFYSTRMWLKRLGNVLESRLQSAEILNFQTILLKKLHKDLEYKPDTQEQLLTKVRQALSLFQHHDAITGTSTDFVTEDFRQRLVRAIHKCDHSMEQSFRELFNLIMKSNKVEGGAIDVQPRVMTEQIDDRNMIDYVPVHGTKGLDIMLFNPLLSSRVRDMSVVVETRGETHLGVVKYTMVDNKLLKLNLKCQLDEVIKHSPLSSKFKLSFPDVISPLGVALYSLVPVGESDTSRCIKAHVESLTSQITESTFAVRGNRINAEFDSTTGNLLRINLPNGLYNFSAQTGYYLYKAVKDGAYIFGPQLPPAELAAGRPRSVKLSLGSLFSSVVVQHNDMLTVTYKIPLKGDVHNIAIEVQTNMTGNDYSNHDLVMRLTTDIKPQRLFFTDSNGFHSIVRERMGSMPLEANFYPATSYVFIESSLGKNNRSTRSNVSEGRENTNARRRLTLLMSDPHGVGNTAAGVIEIMLDRRLSYDDGRGMGSGVQDNRLTITNFQLLFEEIIWQEPPSKTKTSNEFRQLSLPAHMLINELRRPPVIAALTPLQDDLRLIFLTTIPAISINHTLPSDVSLTTLRYIDQSYTESKNDLTCFLVLHKFDWDSDIKAYTGMNPMTLVDKPVSYKQKKIRCDFQISSLFPQNKIVAINHAALTLLDVGKSFRPSETTCLNTSSLNSFLVHFSA